MADIYANRGTEIAISHVDPEADRRFHVVRACLKCGHEVHLHGAVKLANSAFFEKAYRDFYAGDCAVCKSAGDN